MIRLLVLLLLCVLAFAACDRYINLTPPPDAHSDGIPPDAAHILDTPGDAFAID